MTTAIHAEHVSKRYRPRGGAGRTLKELLLGQKPAAIEVKGLVMRWLIGYLQRHSLVAFGAYRLVVAAALVALLAFAR